MVLPKINSVSVMANPNFFMFASCLLLGLFMAAWGMAAAQPVGVCYGMLGNNLPSPQQVVNLYRSRNIKKMRLYDPNPAVLQALRGSGIQLILGAPNQDLRRLAAEPAFARDWVRKNVQSYWPSVQIRYISVGNEVIPGNMAQSVLPAMRNIYSAIQSAGLQDKIKVSTAIHTVVLGNSYPPSQGAFSDQSRPFMEPIIRFLASNRAPLMANVYPYFSYVGNPRDISLSYALFTTNSVIVQDGSRGYRNLFDAMVDALYSAVERVGGSNVEIIVTESGWPSAGNGNVATIRNAQTYNSNLIRHAAQGTPKRPGRAIETYVFAMFNENKKDGPEIERHFGLFHPNQQPVYPINFSLLELDTELGFPDSLVSDE